MYLREYRTFLHIASDCGISEAQCWRIVTGTEKLLLKSTLFHLPGKKVLHEADLFEVIVVDVAETPIERPKKISADTTQARKEACAQESGTIDKGSGKIICVVGAEGRRYDFRLFKESKVTIHPKVRLEVDTGYQGILKRHANTDIPKKKSKKNPLTQTDKKRNREISSITVVVKKIIRCLKIFRVLAERYRSRRKPFTLRLNLIAGIYNYQL